MTVRDTSRLLTNVQALLILGFLVGLTVNLNFIGAQSYLLSQIQPIHALYLNVVAGIVFTLVLKFIRWKGKFARFAFLACLAYLACHALLLLPLLPHVKAMVWFFLAMIAIGLFRWLMDELCLHHLDPARAQSMLATQVVTCEGGAIVCVLLLKTLPFALSPGQMTLFALVLFLCIGLIILYQFVPTANLQLKFSRREEGLPSYDHGKLESFMLAFAIMLFLVGIVRNSEDYLFRTVLKHELGNFEAIQQMSANILLLSSILIILLGGLVGNHIRKYRTSPIRLWVCEAVIGIIAVAVCAVYPVFYAFMAIMVVRRVSQNLLFSPGNNIVVSSFVATLRQRCNSSKNLFLYTLPGIVMSLLFSAVQGWDTMRQIYSILLMIGATLLGMVATATLLRHRLLHLLYDFASSHHKTAAITALQTLAYLRPRDFVPRMADMLATQPKKLLRKTIILGLGFSRDETAIDIIQKEFASDKEEIQMAALDALRVAGSYDAVQFLANVMMAQLPSKSLRVRLSATYILAGMYGKMAIPFLLNGLNDEDPRVIANTLEALGLYRDVKLLPYMESHANSPVPRIKANALIAMSAFAKTRRQARLIIQDILESRDQALLPSMLYAVGRCADRHFLPLLEDLARSDLRTDVRVRAPLAWALTRLGQREGYDLFAELLVMPKHEEKDDGILHYYSQLNREERFDLVRHVAQQYRNHAEAIRVMKEKLWRSPMDFHEELDTLNLLALP